MSTFATSGCLFVVGFAMCILMIDFTLLYFVESKQFDFFLLGGCFICVCVHFRGGGNGDYTVGVGFAWD